MSRVSRKSALCADVIAPMTKRFALRILALGALPAAIGTGCATSAPPIPGLSDASDPTLSVGPPPFQSAYTNYQSYREQRVAGWKEVHQEVSSGSAGDGHAGHAANGAKENEASEEAPPIEKGPHDSHGTPSTNR